MVPFQERSIIAVSCAFAGFFLKWCSVWAGSRMNLDSWRLLNLRTRLDELRQGHKGKPTVSAGPYFLKTPSATKGWG